MSSELVLSALQSDAKTLELIDKHMLAKANLLHHRFQHELFSPKLFDSRNRRYVSRYGEVLR